ncbi:YcxB family protein [Alteribacter natronophilus]|uniref:YcxB family protein n=1 Tax=Alteribacter natronophilus TaxID=2583810 RepID=UPI001486B4C3|nr:YcxB family protein [Alteribacter natronophilus]
MSTLFENKELEFGGELTKKEFKQYNLYVTKKERYRLFFTAILIGFVCYQLIVPDIQLITSVMIALALAFLMIPITRMLSNYKAEKEFNSDQLIQNHISYSADHEGIKQRIKKSHSHYEWADILTAFEHSDMFRLQLSERKAIVLPKRYFENEKEVEAFKELVKEQLPSDKIKFM